MNAFASGLWRRQSWRRGMVGRAADAGDADAGTHGRLGARTAGPGPRPGPGAAQDARDSKGLLPRGPSPSWRGPPRGQTRLAAPRRGAAPRRFTHPARSRPAAPRASKQELTLRFLRGPMPLRAGASAAGPLCRQASARRGVSHGDARIMRVSESPSDAPRGESESHFPLRRPSESYVPPLTEAATGSA